MGGWAGLSKAHSGYMQRVEAKEERDWKAQQASIANQRAISLENLRASNKEAGAVSAFERQEGLLKGSKVIGSIGGVDVTQAEYDAMSEEQRTKMLNPEQVEEAQYRKGLGRQKAEFKEETQMLIDRAGALSAATKAEQDETFNEFMQTDFYKGLDEKTQQAVGLAQKYPSMASAVFKSLGEGKPVDVDDMRKIRQDALKAFGDIDENELAEFEQIARAEHGADFKISDIREAFVEFYTDQIVGGRGTAEAPSTAPELREQSLGSPDETDVSSLMAMSKDERSNYMDRLEKEQPESYRKMSRYMTEYVNNKEKRQRFDDLGSGKAQDTSDALGGLGGDLSRSVRRSELRKELEREYPNSTKLAIDSMLNKRMGE